VYRFCLIASFLIATAPISNSQTSNASGRQNDDGKAPQSTKNQNHAMRRSQARLVISRVDEQVIREFERAWNKAGHGVLLQEALVLIYRMPDDSIRAVAGGHTNEGDQLTFEWNQAIIAVVHTHPNKAAPEPQGPDLLIADKFGVPMFTLTRGGMYLYDPATRKTTKVHDGLDWLKPTTWARNSALNNNQIAMQ
jgi:hypothetical protein